jgi:hypothetical protein
MGDDFLTWASKGWKWTFVLVSFVSSLIEIAAASGKITQWLRGVLPRLPDLTSASDALQWLAMLALLIPCFFVRPKPGPGGSGGSDSGRLATLAAKKFWESWVWLIAMWLFFYLALFLRQVLGPAGESPVWGPGIDALNNLQGAFLFICYWHLTGITVRAGDERSQPHPLLFVGVALFFIADIIATVHSTSGGSLDQTRMLFQLGSGLWVGVCLGLLTGCLESEYLNVTRQEYLLSRRFVISLMYLYAVLQVAYVGFGVHAAGLRLIEEFATVLSLPLKVLFILFCLWMLQEHRLEFYMLKTRQAIEGADVQWQEFLKPTDRA